MGINSISAGPKETAWAWRRRFLGGGLSANPHNTREHKEFAQPRFERCLARMHPQRHLCVRNKLIHERGQSGTATHRNEKITKKVMRRGNAGEKVPPGTEVGKSSPADWPRRCEIAPTDTRRRREDSQPISEKSSKLHKFVKWPQPWGGNRLAALDPVG